MLDGIGHGDLAHITPLALSQQVSQSLIVDLNVGCLQAILPALLLQALHGLQDLESHNQDISFCVTSIFLATSTFLMFVHIISGHSKSWQTSCGQVHGQLQARCLQDGVLTGHP